jgi:hypothetical protein
MSPVASTLVSRKLLPGLNGYVVGTWKRTIKTKMVNVEIELFTPLQPAETRALQDVVERSARFMNLPVTPSYT